MGVLDRHPGRCTSQPLGWLLLNAQLRSAAGPVIPWLALTLLATLTPVAIALVIYMPARRASQTSPRRHFAQSRHNHTPRGVG
jgi:hypothetical protein